MPVLSQKALHSSSQEGCGLQNKPRLQCSYTAVPSCSWPAATSASSLVIDGNRCCRNGLQHVWDHAYPLLLAHGRGDQTVLMLSATLAEAVVPPGAVVSGVSPCSLLILCTALFSSLWAWNYCCATTLWPGFSSPLVSSVWDCVPSWCWQHTHLSGFLYMCLFQHFTVLTSWTWDGRI